MQELNDELLADVVGSFSEGGFLMLKTGAAVCPECGLRRSTFTCLGKDGPRLVHVALPCGHRTYIPSRALTEI